MNILQAPDDPKVFGDFFRAGTWVAWRVFLAALFGLPMTVVVTVLMFVGIFSRMIPSQALISAIPEITKRGSFNAVSASVQQLSGGIASVIAGMVVAQGPGGELQHFDELGYVVVATTLLSLGLMYFVQRAVARTDVGDCPDQRGFGRVRQKAGRWQYGRRAGSWMSAVNADAS